MGCVVEGAVLVNWYRSRGQKIMLEIAYYRNYSCNFKMSSDRIVAMGLEKSERQIFITSTMFSRAYTKHIVITYNDHVTVVVVDN